MELTRSILCIPGHRADFAEKAREHGADQLLWDLEDSVPPALKERAREVIEQHLQLGDAIRINPPDSPYFERDMEFVNMWPGTVWVPKCEGSWQLAAVCDKRRNNGAPQDIAHVVVLESPAGVALALRDLLAYRSMWTGGLAFGRHDFIAAAGLGRAQENFVNLAAAQVALAARAVGVPCWMAPSYGQYPVTVSSDAELAFSLGFTGMGCIRPSQIPIIHEAFSFSEAELDRAQQLVEAAEARPDDAVFRNSDGDLVSPPTVKWARKVLG